MSSLIQIKDVPDDVHRTLKMRAAESGQSLSEFLRTEISKIASRPTMAEFVRRLEERGPLSDERDTTAGDVRELRDEE